MIAAKKRKSTGTNFPEYLLSRYTQWSYFRS